MAQVEFESAGRPWHRRTRGDSGVAFVYQPEGAHCRAVPGFGSGLSDERVRGWGGPRHHHPICRLSDAVIIRTETLAVPGDC